MSSSRTASAAVKGLAEKLQAGWAMLAQSCPRCHTPLVREKGGQRIYCVGCELWVVRESDVNKKSESESNATAAEPAVAATAPTAAATNAPPPLASLSDHLEYGRITSELRAENDEEDEDDDDDEEEEEAVPVPSQKSKTAMSLEEYARSKALSRAAAVEAEAEEYGAPTVSSASVDAHMRRVDDLSARLGAKMLAGWSLLGEACPNESCSCPLMRARGELSEMLCVNCGATVIKEGEDRLVIKKTSDKKPVNENVTVAAPVAARTEKAAPRSTRRQFDDDEDSYDDADADLLRQAEEDDEDEDFVPSPSQAANNVDIADPYRFTDLPADLSDPVPTNTTTARRTASSSSSASSDETSAKIGEKMMQGYALLAQCCPRDDCGCPLVRKRGGPMLCVRCGSTVVDASEYDERVHGRAENAATPSAKVEEAESSPSKSPSSRTPSKRLASPGLNDLRAEQSVEKRTRGVDFASPSGVGAASSSIDESNLSSGLPSPTFGGHSRSWSQELENGEAAVDPRLKVHAAQLGGKSGRFNAPRSRAPSLSVQAGATPFAHRTSSAALNAAAHMAFSSKSGGTSSRRSVPSSLEQSPLQSPSHRAQQTPPQTPIVPSLALAPTTFLQPVSLTTSSSTPAPSHRYPHSRHPSVTFGPASPLTQAAQPHLSSPFYGGGVGRGSILKTASGVGESAVQQVPSASTSPAPLEYASVLGNALATLVAKLDETRAQLVSATEGATIRDLAHTMRELVTTINALQTTN